MTRKNTATPIYIISGIVTFVLLFFITILLFSNGNENKLPFTYTANPIDTIHYSYNIHTNTLVNTYLDDTYLAIFDTNNLTFSNVVGNPVCWPVCSWNDQKQSKRIQVEISGAIFKVYEVQGLSIEENHLNDKQYFTISYFESDNKVKHIENFESLSSLEDHLQQYEIYTFASPSNFEIITTDEKNKSYQIRLFSDYVEIFQDTIFSNCDITHVFNELRKDFQQSYYRSRSIYINEKCQNAKPQDSIQFQLFFATDTPPLISVKNADYVLPNNLILENGDDGNYIIIMEEPEDFKVSTLENEVSFYTEGFNDNLGPYPNGATQATHANIAVKELAGNLIIGKNEYKVLPFSELNVNNVENLETDFNLINVNNSLDYFPLQARGDSGEALLNRDALVSDEKMKLENFKSLAIPVLTAIMTTLLAFLLGLFIGRKDEQRNK